MATTSEFDYQTYLASREWAQKREAVRQRAGNRCERCGAPMQAVHHLTYERIGCELLTDLMAICNPCHQFLSAKTDADPITSGIGIYLAGPITHNRWRDKLLLPNKYSYGDSETNSVDGDTGCERGLKFSEYPLWPTAKAGLTGGFDFTGPWFQDLSGGHGCYLEPSTHGYDVFEPQHHAIDPMKQQRVIHACKWAIRNSKVVFCWLHPKCEPYGSMWELGYAAGLQKYIVIAEQVSGNGHNDWWFARQAAQLLLNATDVVDAWQQFIDLWPQLRRTWLSDRPRLTQVQI